MINLCSIQPNDLPHVSGEEPLNYMLVIVFVSQLMFSTTAVLNMP
ncbi:MAG: hypothetical protein ACI8VC_002992 [Candidatus Endobugula sp.]|jgi:hypothetical protein